MANWLAAFDLDGTLLNTQKEVSPAVREAVRFADERGVTVALDTGRMLSECRGVLAALPEVRWAVTCTGARVCDVRTGRTVLEKCLTAEEGRSLYERLRGFDALLGYFAGGRVHDSAARLRAAELYAPAPAVPLLRAVHAAEEDLDAFVASWDGPVEKIHLYFRAQEERDRARAAVEGLGFFVTTTEGADLEIMRAGADKGTGLLALAQTLGIPRGRVAAMGDNENDRQMLACAGVAAVPANGLASLPRSPGASAPSNAEDGAAWFLRRLAEGAYDG